MAYQHCPESGSFVHGTGYSATGGGTAQPGNGTIYVFTMDTYQYYENDSLRQNGTYKITDGTNSNTGELMPAIVFDKDPLYSTCYAIKDDVLMLYHGSVATDGTVLKFARIANPGDDSSGK